jgi:hypothetical protein
MPRRLAARWGLLVWLAAGFLLPISVRADVGVASRGAPTDLTRIKRSIGKEPPYESRSPQYCLLVFGSEAKVRVWLVLDGDVLYLDRNGNGDLTDPGERIVASEVLRRPAERPDIEVMRTFELNCWKPGQEPVLTCGPKVNWFCLRQMVPREDYPDRDEVKDYLESPFDLAVTTDARTTSLGYEEKAERASLQFASLPQDAPVVHFGGPRHLAVSEKFGPFVLRQGETSELYVELTTPGLKATVRANQFGPPKDVHPIAEIEFLAASQNGERVRLRAELKGRC